MNLIAWPDGKIEFLAAQGFSRTTLIRFWKYVRITRPCWLWEGGTTGDGYGAIEVGRHKKKRAVPVHVVSWIIHFGSVPNGLCVLHTCDIRHCVNPAHLWLGTKGQNNKDAAAKGRSSKGEKRWNAKLSEAEVIRIRQLRQIGYLQKDIAEEFGVSQSQTSSLILRKTWKHI